MRLTSQLFFCLALFFGTGAGMAQEATPTEEHRAPANFGFPRPERQRDSSANGSAISGGSAGRSSIRIPLHLGFTGIGDDQGSKSAGRLITVEVTLAETPVVGNGKEMSAEKIAELEKAGTPVPQSRYWVSLVENQRSELQFAERVQVVVGRINVGGGRGMQETMAYEEVGTKLGLVGRVDGESVLVQMDLNQTRLIPAPAKPEGEASETVIRPRTATTNFQSTLKIPPGKTVVAGGRERQTERGIVQTWLLVSAHAEEKKPEVADDEPKVKIFKLMNAKAEMLAAAMQGIFGGENVRIGVDSRTNSIIVRGDDKTLAILYRILIGLDEDLPGKKCQ